MTVSLVTTIKVFTALEADDKPDPASVPVGSRLTELDTGDVYHVVLVDGVPTWVTPSE